MKAASLTFLVLLQFLFFPTTIQCAANPEAFESRNFSLSGIFFKENIYLKRADVAGKTGPNKARTITYFSSWNGDLRTIGMRSDFHLKSDLEVLRLGKFANRNGLEINIASNINRQLNTVAVSPLKTLATPNAGEDQSVCGDKV
ncbi:MAG TPA: hypothetical protein VF691_12760 [Cytophagaceae bacterium]|jgi:hypothetical protein